MFKPFEDNESPGPELETLADELSEKVLVFFSPIKNDITPLQLRAAEQYVIQQITQEFCRVRIDQRCDIVNKKESNGP